MIDPVCGISVEKTVKAIIGPDGKKYRFCCALCQWAFEKDPDSFINK